MVDENFDRLNATPRRGYSISLTIRWHASEIGGLVRLVWQVVE